MKVYFVGSITGKKQYLGNYRRIVEALKKQGVDVTENTLDPSEDYVKSLSDEGKVEYYKKVLNWINAADIIIAEGSYQSIGVGHEISLAIGKGKPVVVLHQKGTYAAHFLEGLQSDKLMVLQYDLDELEAVVKEATDYAAEQVDTRFNFFISPRHQHYLDWISRKRMVPRAVHLRNLLERDMEVNREYQAELIGDHGAKKTK